MNNQDMILKVILWGDVIGYLAWDNISRTATFQFTDTYHKKDYNLQPTRPSKPIPAFRGIPGDRYHGLPPFIADSLPDNWGSLIFEQWAKEKGLAAKDLNPLVKLAYIGRRGMGALEFMPEMDTESDGETDIESLETLAQKTYRERANYVVKESEYAIFNSLAELGTPPGGAHSKVLVAINDNDKTLMSGQTETKDGYSQYILKFKEDYSVPSAEIEFVYYLMAKDAGITMMPSQLIEINGNKHFLTKRFDRKDNRKLLSQTMAALIPNASDYQDLFFLCRTLKLKEEERTELFRRMCFNVVAGNTDDHNKNFSFLMYPDGHWELSPAYDITFTADIWKHSDGDVHSLGIYTKRCYLTASDLITFGEDFEIKSPEYILSQICETVSNFRHIASGLNIPEIWIERICNSLDKVFPERESLVSHK